MTEDDIVWLSAVEIGRRIHARELTAAAVTDAFLARIELLNPTLQAYVTVTGAQARAAARAADAEIDSAHWRGPLHGVPYCLKDIIATAGIRTTVGSHILADWVPERDATVVQRLQEAGAILLGKVNTHEFAFGITTQNIHGQTANPWNLACIPGGSSGGSGAAVATALAAFSIGSDTAGSIRLPAAFCGVVGLKPSYGLVSAAGVVAQSYTADHVGPLTRNVADAATVMQIIAGPDGDDPTSDRASPPSFWPLPASEFGVLRVGIPAELMRMPCASAVYGGLHAARAALQELGADVHEVSVPLLGEATRINRNIILPETSAQHLEWAGSWFAGREIRYHDDVAELLALGRGVAATDFVAASRSRAVLRSALDRTLDRSQAACVDLLLTPTVPVPAVQRGATTVSLAGQDTGFLNVAIHFLCPFSLAGLPSLSIPAGFSDDGLPVAVQLVGRRRDDPTVLAVGSRLQKMLNVQERRPILTASAPNPPTQSQLPSMVHGSGV